MNMGWLSVDNIAFTLMGYPMSWVELVGTVLYLWSVWLITRRNIWTWPVGIVSVLCYLVLFYQIQLYADTAEQVYYLIVSIYGWWHWRVANAGADDKQAVTFSPARQIWIWVMVTAVASLAVGFGLSRINEWLPAVFPLPASFPYLDALTTVMSFTAMWLMARKRTESWIYWIIVDVIGIWLYYVKDVRLISLLYVILLGMAVNGLWSWRRAAREPVVREAGSII